MEKIKPFNDNYFDGLNYEQIAELAKKSIRLTAENRRLEDRLIELEDKYLKVLDLAKQNADANEYCLQSLEKENEKMKTILVDIGFWDINGNYKEDFQRVRKEELNGTNEN